MQDTTGEPYPVKAAVNQETKSSENCITASCRDGDEDQRGLESAREQSSQYPELYSIIHPLHHRLNSQHSKHPTPPIQLCVILPRPLMSLFHLILGRQTRGLRGRGGSKIFYRACGMQFTRCFVCTDAEGAFDGREEAVRCDGIVCVDVWGRVT
jgi:hypothetical protein